MVAISQRVVYIPWFQLGEPQLELTCNTSSSLSPCSPQSLSMPLETSPESQVINSNSRTLSLISLRLAQELSSPPLSQAVQGICRPPVRTLLLNCYFNSRADFFLTMTANPHWP